MPDSDDKYITFRRADQILVTDGLITFETAKELPDAVVIRRQDFFASPALATYAAMIACAIKLTMDPEVSAQLQQVADYFQRQSEIAADEGFKFPDV